MPKLDSDTRVESFREALQNEVQKCCGKLACDGEVRVRIRKTDDKADWRAKGAIILCGAADCPLIDGQETAGDRQSVSPTPPSLNQKAELELPA